MRVPHFVVLAQTDQQHSISACRHGIIHLTWERFTMRFSTPEFQRFAGLLQQAADNPPPSTVRDGQLQITTRPDEDCEARMGALVLLLSPTEFREFAGLAREAAQNLGRFLASGLWDREEPEPPPDVLERVRGTPFSKN